MVYHSERSPYMSQSANFGCVVYSENLQISDFIDANQELQNGTNSTYDPAFSGTLAYSHLPTRPRQYSYRIRIRDIRKSRIRQEDTPRSTALIQMGISQLQTT
jgi:hypothetical protein